jgi:hypothetical protein
MRCLLGKKEPAVWAPVFPSKKPRTTRRHVTSLTTGGVETAGSDFASSSRDARASPPRSVNSPNPQMPDLTVGAGSYPSREAPRDRE